jgi:hypothetical protein
MPCKFLFVCSNLKLDQPIGGTAVHYVKYGRLVSESGVRVSFTQWLSEYAVTFMQDIQV